MADRRPRVLVLNHFAAPRGQAGGTRHVELFSRLVGWDYLVVASDLNPQTGQRVGPERGFAVVPVPSYSSNGSRRVLNWLAYACRATWLGLRQSRIDVVYGSSPHMLAALAAWLIAKLKGATFVMEVRDLWPQVLVDMGALTERSYTFRSLRALEGFLYRRARAIVVMAEGTRSALIERGLPASKLHYVPNGADPADFVPSAPRSVLRNRYNFRRFTAIYAGAHGPANGLHLLLDSAGEVRHLELDIVLVGGGVEKDALVARAARENLTNVRFLDAVPKSEIPDLLAAADLGLHVLADVDLFRSSVSPNKVFDYMAAGLPILTNCPGSVADLIVSAGCGLTCSPASLGEGLERAASLGADPLRQFGASGQDWIQRCQSRAAMADILARTLEETRK